jgi:addiction module HigA family antidote
MNRLPNIHPGEVLREDFLIPLKISQYRLAKEVGVTDARISAICSGKRAITADTALRLAAFFGTTPGFWLGLQADYDTEEAETLLHDALLNIRRFNSVAA